MEGGKGGEGRPRNARNKAGPWGQGQASAMSGEAKNALGAYMYGRAVYLCKNAYIHINRKTSINVNANPPPSIHGFSAVR